MVAILGWQKSSNFFKKGGCQEFWFRYYISLPTRRKRRSKTLKWAFSSGGERFPDTEEVTSSNLVTPTICDADMAQLVEHHLAKVRVAGSNPVVRSIVLDELVGKPTSSL